MNCYNSEKYIKFSIDSVLKQTFLDWELIIWDDCSEDNTYKIAKNYQDKRIKIFKNTKHLGLGFSRVNAQSYLSGKYISILDSDDIFHKDKLKKQISLLEKNDNLSLVTSWYTFIDENGKEILKNNLIQSKNKIINKLIEENIFAHSSIIYRKDHAKKVNWYSKSLKYAQDYDLTLKLIKFGLFDISNNYLVKIRNISSNMTNNKKFTLIKIREKIHILKKISNLFSLNQTQLENNKKLIGLEKFKLLIFNRNRNKNLKYFFKIFSFVINNKEILIVILSLYLKKIFKKGRIVQW